MCVLRTKVSEEITGKEKCVESSSTERFREKRARSWRGLLAYFIERTEKM